MTRRWPHSPQEWRDAAACADVLLAVDAARQYGLITGGPTIDVRRCVDLLARAKAQGIAPTADEKTHALAALLMPETKTP
jgi:hypothetical protein